MSESSKQVIIAAMREVARLLHDMLSSGIICDYALFGAVAQMRYAEAVSTMDADVLVAVPLRGFPVEGEAIRVGAWPVQFILAFSPLTEEAMHEAQTAEIEGISIRVVGADHLAVIALSVGRPKDYARILSLIESGSVSTEGLQRLAERHGLSAEWRRFHSRFLEH